MNKKKTAELKKEMEDLGWRNVQVDEFPYHWTITAESDISRVRGSVHKPDDNGVTMVPTFGVQHKSMDKTQNRFWVDISTGYLPSIEYAHASGEERRAMSAAIHAAGKMLRTTQVTKRTLTLCYYLPGQVTVNTPSNWDAMNNHTRREWLRNRFAHLNVSTLVGNALTELDQLDTSVIPLSCALDCTEHPDKTSDESTFVVDPHLFAAVEGDGFYNQDFDSHTKGYENTTKKHKGGA